jgi:hypothetical protein
MIEDEAMQLRPESYIHWINTGHINITMDGVKVQTNKI